MNEQEAIEILKDFDKQVSAKADGAYQSTIGKMACEAAIAALEEIQRYRAIEKHLADMFGGELPLTKYVDELEKAMKEPNKSHSVNAKILTYEDADRWEAYKAIGTVEECRAAVENLKAAKEDIRKLLCSEYGSSCQFCIHDKDEDAMCCNVGGSGSWCCENAEWNGGLE